jgi:hypothetical protein
VYEAKRVVYTTCAFIPIDLLNKFFVLYFLYKWGMYADCRDCTLIEMLYDDKKSYDIALLATLEKRQKINSGKNAIAGIYSTRSI